MQKFVAFTNGYGTIMVPQPATTYCLLLEEAKEPLSKEQKQGNDDDLPLQPQLMPQKNDP